MALVDETGKVVVEYTYDAWGNMFYRPQNGTTQEQAQRLVQLCPITYRGYNYDFCTGLYYLQSRYYNPKWGRFLNCDDTNILLSTRGEDHGANLFAYGNNNPVNRVDYAGYESHDNSARPVTVNIYDGVVGHSELVIAPNLIFSYGIYDSHNIIEPVKGIQGKLLVIYDETKWYKYDKENNKNRTRTPYTFYLERDQYIGLLIFYLAIIFQSDVSPSELGYIYKCSVKTGKYQTYKLLECNCTTIIRDALFKFKCFIYKE